ncbi:hypothetical protein Lal_00030404 [Lupinus albus]|nr:hypothetical protein Lal_00030404 [Lupinus albus]
MQHALLPMRMHGIAIKDALLKRGFSFNNSGDLLCIFYLPIALPLSSISHYSHHLGMVKNRKHWKAWSVIWLATVWALWLVRNDIVFNMKTTSINNILNSAKVKA